MQIETLDLEFQGIRQIIASYLVTGPSGPVLVEVGPGSTLPRLLAALSDHGISPGDIRHVLVTHIHLDHAGAAGWWARQGATVHVHPFGAPHLIDPSKLIASAGRIYGDQLETLWGDILPAPPECVAVVQDGETFDVAGLRFTALETPGHARHHHAFQLGDVIFTGDAAGIRLPTTSWIDLPAPPPEFDLEAWKSSIRRLRQLEVIALYPTHYGPTEAVTRQLNGLALQLDEVTTYIRAMMSEGLEREEMLQRYAAWLRKRAGEAGLPADLLDSLDVANPRAMSVDGVTRYWRRRADA